LAVKAASSEAARTNARSRLNQALTAVAAKRRRYGPAARSPRYCGASGGQNRAARIAAARIAVTGQAGRSQSITRRVFLEIFSLHREEIRYS
jgi:hypothetical protein